jgi:hypothetical protein
VPNVGYDNPDAHADSSLLGQPPTPAALADGVCQPAHFNGQLMPSVW